MGLAGGGKSTTRSPLKIFGNIFISFIGAGVLGLPYTFRQSGIALGVIIMILVALAAVKAMLLIIESKYTAAATFGGPDGEALLASPASTSSFSSDSSLSRSPAKSSLRRRDSKDVRAALAHINWERLSYADLGLCAFGEAGKRIVEFSIIVSQVGFCCAYLIFIMENLDSYWPGVGRSSWLWILLPVLFLFSLYRDLHRLAVTSLFAQFSNLLAFVVVFWFDFDHIARTKELSSPTQFNLDGFSFFFSVAIYCYEGAGMILTLEASVALDARHKFRTYFVTTIVLVTGLYISFGVAGYLSFGSLTNPIITLNLPNAGGCYMEDADCLKSYSMRITRAAVKSPAKADGIDFAMLVKICLCISLFFTYPVMLFPVTELLEKYFLSNGGGWGPEYGLRFFLVFLTGLVVIWIPSFANLMALIGATCCSLLAFILPATFHLLLHPKATRSQKSINYGLLCVGLVAACLGTVDTVQRLFSKEDVVAQAVARGPLTANHTHPFHESSNLTSVVLAALPNNTKLRHLPDKIAKLRTTTVAEDPTVATIQDSAASHEKIRPVKRPRLEPSPDSVQTRSSISHTRRGKNS